jgi:hypothetical protein
MPAMKSTYQKVGPFDLAGHFLEKNIEYNATKLILPINKPGEYYYHGQVNSKGEKDGIGRSMNIKHALMFEGEYNENEREGYGRAIYNNGNIYEGEWQDWEQHGKGKLSYYLGYFKGKTYTG